MRITDMTKEDFKNVPRLEKTGFDPSKNSFNSLVLVPTDNMHDSGYLCMEYVLVSKDTFEPIGKIGGGSDVIHLDGIGGFGGYFIDAKRDAKGKAVIEPKAWSIDCLPCGYLRLFARNGLKFDKSYEWDISSFEVYAL